jgi:hypothetical protein
MSTALCACGVQAGGNGWFLFFRAFRFLRLWAVDDPSLCRLCCCWYVVFSSIDNNLVPVVVSTFLHFLGYEFFFFLILLLLLLLCVSGFYFAGFLVM